MIWFPQKRRIPGELKQFRVPKNMVSSLKYLTCKERLGRLRLVTLEAKIENRFYGSEQTQEGNGNNRKG